MRNKKWKYCSLFTGLACAAALAGCGVTFIDDPEIKEPADPYTPPLSEITVDGFDDEACWESAPVHSFGIANGATVRLWFGERGLGIFLTAKDTTYNALRNDPDQCDRMEVFFDPLLNGPRENGKPNWDDIALRLGVDGSFSAWFGHDNNTDGYCWTNSYVDFDFVSLYDDVDKSFSQELYIPYKSLNLEGKPDEIAMCFNQVDIITPLKDWWFDQGERVNSVMDGVELNDVTAYPLFNNKGERVKRQTLAEVFEGNEFTSYTPREGAIKRIDTIFTDYGVYLRAVRDTKGETPPLADPQNWWSDGWLTSVTVDLDSSDGACANTDPHRIQAVVRPTGNYAVSKANEWIGDWGSSKKLGVTQQSVYNASDSEYSVMAYIPYSAGGLSAAPKQVGIWPFIGDTDESSFYVQYDPATGKIVSDPYDWENYLKQFDNTVFEGALETVLNDGTQLQAKPTADGVYVRRSMSFTNATLPFVPAGNNFYHEGSWSNGYVRDLFVDFGGEGGESCDGNDFKVTHYIGGQFTLYKRSADKSAWEFFGAAADQWNRNQIDGFKFWIDLNGLSYYEAGQTGKVWICFYASNAVTGLTESPEEVGIGVNLSAEQEGVPSCYTPVGESKLPPRDDATFDGAWTRTVGDTQLDVKLLSEGIYIRQSISVNNATIPSANPSDHWWSDHWCKDMIVNFDASSDAFDGNEFKVTFRPNGDFRLLRHNGTEFIDVVNDHWNSNPIKGYDFWIDMNGLEYDKAGQTGKILVCFYAAFEKIGLTKNPEVVSFYVSGESAENSLSTYVPVNATGTYTDKNAVFDSAWSAATPNGYTVQVKTADNGVYARFKVTASGKVPSVESNWWGDTGYLTKDLFLNLDGTNKKLDANDFKITCRPNGDFRLFKVSGSAWTEVVADHWNANPIAGFDYWVDMQGLKYDTDGQSGDIWYCFFVSNEAAGLTEKSVSVGAAVATSHETDPSMWTTLGDKNAVFANAWNSYTVAGNNEVRIVTTDDGVYVRLSYKVYSSQVPSVVNWGNIYGNSCRHEIFVNLDGSDTAFGGKIFKITAMANGYNRMFQGKGTSFEELHSDITNTSVEGLEYWTDANGIAYDTAGQTGVMWYNVYISYGLGGVTQKPSSIGFALNPEGSNETKPETYTKLTNKSAAFANATKATANGYKFEVAADESAIYVRMAVPVNNENIPSVVNWDNIWGGAHPREMFINVNTGVTTANTNNLFKITGMENSYNRMFRGGGSNWDAGELHSGITNDNSVEGLEYWTDANGVVYDIGGQTGKMWYCFKLSYSLAGLSGKPAQIGIAAGGVANETDPTLYTTVNLA